jgi:FkbM family methyltransferase
MKDNYFLSQSMINIRKIEILKPKSLLGKILRLPFRFIPDEAVVTILKGPLRGKKWINSSHNKSIWFGLYERSQTAYFIDRIKSKKVFWDLGAHVGYYTLQFCKLNPGGSVFAFEPLERNVLYFEKHMQLNNIKGYKIFKVAVSNAEGTLRFAKGTASVAGKLSSEGETEVEVIKLSSWYENGKISPPEVIKMDIEGAEINVLHDLKGILINRKPILFLSTHGQLVHDDCISLLEEIGYKVTPLDDANLKNAREILAEYPS